MILGAFTADSLALGAHWVYDTAVIDREFGRITELCDPLAKNYHPNRSVGEHTHYGDQMLFFFEYIRNTGRLEPEEYMKAWAGFYDSYNGYKDHAMQETRKNIESAVPPCGSDSTDLSGVFYVPILAAFLKDSKSYLSDVETAVRMTHDSGAVIQAARFLAGLLSEVIDGMKPMDSINRSLQNDSLSPALKSVIRRGLDSKNENTRTAIAGFGQSCPADYGLPGVIHLIAAYENDFENALIENVMAGGDSAARGIFVGSVLGAHNGFDKIPVRWLDRLSAYENLYTA